jgi:YD repeat-containing protein
MSLPQRELAFVQRLIRALIWTLAVISRRLGDAFKLGAVVMALVLSAPAAAELVVTQQGPNSFHYEDDFDSASAAKAACDNFVSQYNVTCYSAGGSDPQPYVRWTVYEAGWIQTPTSTILVDFWYCELPQLHLPGTHKCVMAAEEITSNPKVNGDPNGCNCDEKKEQPKHGNPINPATGNKFQREVDIPAHRARSTLGLARFYNSSVRGDLNYWPQLFGNNWVTRYDVTIASEPVRIESKCYRRMDTQELVCKGLPVGPEAASVKRPDGKIYRFNKSSSGWPLTQWPGDANVNDTLWAEYDADHITIIGWTYISGQNNEVEKFDVRGRLLSIKARSGATQYLTYSDGISNDTSAGRYPSTAPACSHIQAGQVLPVGKLVCVTDDRGGQLGFEYDDLGLNVVKSIDASGQEYVYSYAGVSSGCLPGAPTSKACMAKNLTTVTYPDLKNKVYWYNESANINGGVNCPYTTQVGNGFGHLPTALTGLVDENGARYATWTYDCAARATSSQHAGGVEKVTLTYSSQSATGYTTAVTHFVGSSAAPATTAVTIAFSMFDGVPKFTQFYGRCIECGSTSTATYDLIGNMTSAKDRNGNLTCFSYGPGNLETARIEGLPGSTVCSTALASSSLTAPARRISTQWLESDRLPSLVAEPLKITTFTYNTAGKLLTRSEQATTDATGVTGAAATLTGPVRTWTYTYNDAGQVLTATGPRSDVNDTTTNTYDVNGNLTSIKNAIGQITALKNYDANGRVGRIERFNGVATEFVYSPRGWLTTRSDTAAGITQTTAYEYDGVGQLKKVTSPDSSFIAYTYDDAHRLTGVADSAGNTVSYTLDYRGNRIAEKIRDPGGALARQISREFDTLNLLKSVTGSAE